MKIAQIVPLHCTKRLPELKLEKTSNDISTLTTILGRFQPNLIGLFLGRSSTKIAQIFLVRCTKCWPELKIEKKFKQHLHLTKLLGLFLGRSSTKIAQTVPLQCTKWLSELKIEKKTSNNISVTTVWISAKLDRIVLWEVLYQR